MHWGGVDEFELTLLDAEPKSKSRAAANGFDGIID